VSAAIWFRDRQAWRLIARGYLPWLAVLMLVWEVAHAPLYTLWRGAEPWYIAFSVVHCTVGDVLIGVLALLLSLILLRERAAVHWRWARIAALTVVLGVSYTAFSEWMNLTVLRSWTYAESMPTITLGGAQIGLTPLVQWLVVPPLALYLSRRARRARAG
jgi:hypothetical protein